MPVWVTIPPGRGQLEGQCLVIEVTPQRARLGPGDPACRVDVDRAHQRQVHDQPSVAQSGSGYVVTATPDRHEQPALAGEADSRKHIGGPSAPGDQAGHAVDGTVPDPARFVIPLVTGRQYRPGEPTDLRFHRHSPPHTSSVHLGTGHRNDRRPIQVVCPGSDGVGPLEN